MAIFTFPGVGAEGKITNWFRQKLNSNFTYINNILLQRLHGGAYQITTETLTTVSAQDTITKVLGTLTADAHAYGYDIGTGASVTHNHTEPSGTTHFYDILAVLHLEGNNNDVITVTLRMWDDSASSYVTLEESTEEIVTGGGGHYHIKAILSAREAIADSDRVELWITQTVGSGDVTAKEGTFIQIRGV